MINLPENNCIDCKFFTWWDGDYCCVRKAKLLQTSKDGKFNIDILKSLRLNKNCDSFDKESNSLYKEEFNKFLKIIKYEV